MKGIKRNILTCLAAVSAAVVMLSGCSGYKDIRVDACRLERISPAGMRAVDIGFIIGVNNPVREITVSDISGKVYLNDTELGQFEAPDITVPGKKYTEIHAGMRATLSASVSLMQIMSMASGFDPEDLFLDVSLTVKVKGGIRKNLDL